MVKLGRKILNKQWQTYVQLRSYNAELITLLLYLLHVHKSILIFKDKLPIIDNERVHFKHSRKKKDPSRNEAIHLITLNILISDYYSTCFIYDNRPYYYCLSWREELKKKDPP